MVTANGWTGGARQAPLEDPGTPRKELGSNDDDEGRAYAKTLEGIPPAR